MEESHLFVNVFSLNHEQVTKDYTKSYFAILFKCTKLKCDIMLIDENESSV